MKRLALLVLVSILAFAASSNCQQVVKEQAYQIILPDGWAKTTDLPYGIDVGFIKSFKDGETTTFFFHYEFMDWH